MLKNVNTLVSATFIIYASALLSKLSLHDADTVSKTKRTRSGTMPAGPFFALYTSRTDYMAASAGLSAFSLLASRDTRQTSRIRLRCAARFPPLFRRPLSACLVNIRNENVYSASRQFARSPVRCPKPLP
ncbi:hypothetical protein [Saccharibacillus deserti]|uniref:hypothetical protein n=1 Tax=Saccharibacillus deserti TaxID=1634444 RepID=UPI00155431B6|nr:hypothetical protein [Saccharibacillus deserti]